MDGNNEQNANGRQSERLGSTGYTPYREVEAAGSRIGLMTCLRCGAAVVIDPGDLEQAMTIHDRWHASMSNTGRQVRREEEKDNG